MTVSSQHQLRSPLEGLPSDEPVYLVDGHSLTFKAYYGVRGLTAPDGTPTGAVYGFLRMLLKLIQDQKARCLVVVFDTGSPTFRSQLYKEYKANREAPPPDFGTQMALIYELLDSMGLPTYQLVGYEADDLIATIAHDVASHGGEAVVCSADKDLFQLVRSHTRMLRFGSKDVEIYDEAGVEAKLGIRPDQVPDWLALVGDSSDNIPGVPTIGEKGAVKLLQEFGTLEAMVARASEIKNERQRNSLIENQERARLARKLATVVHDVPFEWDPSAALIPANLWNERSSAMLARLGFNSLIKELGLKAPIANPQASVPSALSSAPPPDQIPTEYKLITSVSELEAWVSAAKQSPWLALDTETTDVDPMVAGLVGISLAHKAGQAIYIPVGHNVGIGADCVQIPVATLRGILNPLFVGGAGLPQLSAHNAKFDWKMLERAGFKLAAPAFDTMIASFVLDPARASGHGLKALGSEFAGVAMSPISDIIGEGKNALTMDQVAPDAVRDYAARDADVTLRLTESFAAKLAAIPSLDKLFREIEIPLIPVLHRMEVGGFGVDPKMLQQLGQVMNRRMEVLAKEIWAAAGRQFNIDSPRQVAEILFEDLKLPPGKKTKTGYSTDTEVLENLEDAHAIVKLILEYRAVTKLKSTYADALPRQINPRTKRIHTSFNQTIAQTGRLSSTSPNLQNIPIRSELGREIRRTFIPDAPDHLLISADYSQIELRILAHFTGDEALRRAYAENKDIHALTASRVFGVDESDVTSEMRAKAKIVNFGIVYGMSAHGLSQRLKISRPEAARFIDAYFAGYPKVRIWMDQTLEQGRQLGYVETLCGRRRWLPELTAKNGQLRQNAERIAINTPIQGTSADMIKLAMITVDRELASVSSGARMVCQVHDELLFSVPEKDAAAVTEFARDRMTRALPLDVPVVVDASTGRNWAECGE